MLVVYAIVRVLSPYIALLSNVILSRKGAEYISAAGILTSTANIFTAPLTTIAAILVIVAVGRYGISSKK
jgi:membrane-anchored glycerophosphoryl diester phosphodiesterase (GDPDase)